MRILPANSSEWSIALLRPFKAYTVGGYVLLCFLGRLRGIAGLRAVAEAVLAIHLLTFALLVFAGLVQLALPTRREALSTFVYALGNMLVLWLYVPYLVVA